MRNAGASIIFSAGFAVITVEVLGMIGDTFIWRRYLRQGRQQGREDERRAWQAWNNRRKEARPGGRISTNRRQARPDPARRTRASTKPSFIPACLPSFPPPSRHSREGGNPQALRSRPIRNPGKTVVSIRIQHALQPFLAHVHRMYRGRPSIG